MFYYRIYGVILGSETELPWLVSAGADAWADIYIRKKHFSAEERTACTAEYSVIGKERSSFYNDTLICLAEGGTTISYEPAEGAPEETVAAFLLGYGLAMLFLQRNRLAVHCSGVAKDGRALMISGRSGAGKSSLTNRFLEHGYRLMADDMMMAGVEGNIAMAYPAFPYTKLCADLIERRGFDKNLLTHIDEGKDKYLVPYEGEFFCKSEPLAALCVIAVLAEGAPVQTCEVDGIEKLRLVIDNLFIDRGIMFYESNPLVVLLAAELAAHIRVILVGRPEGLDTTEEQYTKVIKILNK